MSVLMRKANFYDIFIEGFSKIVMLFASMLKTNLSIDLLTRLSQIIIEYNRVDSNSSYSGDFDVM